MPGRIYINKTDWARNLERVPVMVIGGSDDVVHDCITEKGSITLPDNNQTRVELGYGGLAVPALLERITEDGYDLGDLVVREFS